MKQERKRSSKIVLLVLALVLLVASLTVILTSAADEIEIKGDMIAIKEAFDGKYLAQATVRADDDYVGNIQYTAYYDTSKGKIVTGYEGTPVVIYTINHPEIERVGTDSDVDIIQSMLDRGYVVIVLDYLNSKKAISPYIDNSSQQFRINLRNGNIIKTSDIFPSGSYHENFLAPSGCNVSLFNVFWEIDKHSAEGTLEKIVENWNSDFRATKGGKLLKWATGDTVDTRKAVQNDLDGNAPVWYNASGKADENGLYTYVKFTKAETITDCVDPDGSFLDMNLYIHIVYPTNPEKEVPVMALANSSGYPTTSVTGADIRPHSNGFLYNGYANVVFDYLWQPMARNASWGYYDGSQGNTADHMNYGLMMYNDKLVNTAAMRYLRYISLAGGTEYNFDLDKFGVYGNSKGGWFSFLGEEVLQSELVDASKYSTTEALEEAINAVISDFIPDRYYNGHHGETRYQVGAGAISKDGFTLNAGEKQPWLTYNGKEVLSGAQLTNACNGSQEEDITAGHSPIFISGNMTDTYNAAYSYSVNIYNMCRELNIPLLHFEVPIGHTLTSGQDMNYNVDTYEAFFRYVNYYLKSTPISVSHVSPMNNAGNVSVTDKITVYFAGAVTETEIAKVTVTSANGVVNGQWESSFGGTTWTFTPDALTGSTLYTVTVPATLKGDNGVEMGAAYTTSFSTELDNESTATVNEEYSTVTVPAFTTGNSFVYRFHVSNDAVNVAELYAVSAKGETTGEYLGSVKVNGAGSYEIDITDFAAKNTGKTVVLYLKAAKAAGNVNYYNTNGVEYDPFDTYSKSNTSQVTYTTGATIDGETAFKVAITGPVNSNNISYYYSNVTSVFSQTYVVGKDSLLANEGKRFVISFDVYDTVSRRVQVKLNSMTNRVDYGTIDYNNILFTLETKANEWTHVEFTYNAYETMYGFVSNNKTQSLHISLSPDGDLASPAYFNNLKAVEITTALDVTSAVIAEKNDGTGMPYTPAVSTTPFAVYNGDTLVGEYATWKAALAAYKSGYTIKLQSDYTFVDADISNAIGSFAVVNVDLGGYTITSENTKNSLLYACATNSNGTTVNVSGGAILLNKTPLISYESSTAAGNGKVFNVNLNGTYIGFTDNAYTTEVLSATTASSGASVTTNVSLNGCTVDLPDANHARDAFVVFTNPTATTLKVRYTVTGGEFKLTSQRWATLSENANIVDFKKDANGNYTTLVMPKSNTYSVSGSYLNEVGFATYAKAYEENNMVTYVLENSANSTRYGIITDNYADADKYPFLLFKDGVLLSGYTTLAKAIAGANSVLGDTKYAESEAQILLRKSIKNTEEPTYGGTTGTLVIDLNGYTLTRDKVIINAVVNSSTPMFETNVVFKNGRLDTSGNVIAVTHCLFTTTNVKEYNFTFDEVTFGFAAGATKVDSLFWTIWQNNHPTVIDTDITLKNCTIDLDTNKPANTGSLFNVATAQAECDIVVEGGTVKGNGSGISLFKTDANDSVLLKQGANGSYLTFVSTNGGTPVTDALTCDDGTHRKFQATENGYELKVDPLATKYGSVGSAYADAEKYPFALFTNGNFVGAYTHWANTSDKDATEDAKDVIQRAKDQVSGINGAGKTTVILLRRDYALDSTEYSSAEEFYNWSQAGGTILVDLNGYTLTLGSKTFLSATKKGTTTNNVTYIHDTNIQFINGNINLKDSTLISYGTSAALTESKEFNFVFDNVTFTFTGTKAASLVACGGGFKGTAALLANVTFNNCTFDYSTASSDNFTLFNINNSLLDATVTVKGGKIVSNIDALNKITVASLGNNGEVNFVKGDNGSYTTLTTPTTAAYKNVHYAKPVNTPEGQMYFIEMKDDGTSSYYELGKMAYDGYGTIKTSESKFLSAVDFPFVTFMDGTFKAGFGTWKEAINSAKGLVAAAGTEGKTVIILMRRDYDLTKAKDSGSNFNSARGSLVLDLNGFTLTNTDNYFIDIYFNYTSSTDIAYLGYKSSIEIKNGTMLNERTGYPMIAIGHVNKNDSYPIKEFSFTFTGVTFKTGSGVKYMIQEWGPNTSTNAHCGDGLKLDYVFDGCTFNFTDATAGTNMLIATNTYNQQSIVIKGGAIIADNIANYTLYSVANGATNYFAKDSNGKYTVLIQPTSSAAPTVTFKNSAGEVLSFVVDSYDGNYTIYSVAEPIKTPYGDIPAAYKSADVYPFVAFDEKGNFIGAAKYFYGANKGDSIIGISKDYLSKNVWDGTSYGASPRAVYIVLRGDYTMATDERYDNLSQIQGILTIDLNGNTFTMNDSRTMFPTCIKPWGGSGDAKVFPSEIDILNGTIALSSKPMITFSAWSASGTDVSTKIFTFDFTNVKFVAPAKASNMFASYDAHSETPDAIGNAELIFNDCVFDLTKATTSKTLFDLGNGYVHTNVTVNGGEIIANAQSFNMFVKNENTVSNLTFGKGTNGSYTTLTVPTDVEAPADSYLGANGEKLVFVKGTEAEGNVTYALSSVSMNGYKIKTSITLWSNFVYNIYIPAKDFVGATVNGNAVTYTEVTVDDVLYYHVKVDLPAGKTLSDITLVVTVNNNGTNANATWTLNVLNYTKAIMAGEYTDVTKTLMKDMLAYAYAAHTYFENTSDEAAKLLEVESILDGYKADMPTGEAKKPTDSKYFTDVAVHLGEVPSFRFYLATGYTKDSFTFTVGGKAANVKTGTDENGSYLEITMYAYMMLNDVTYTVIGTETSETYNLYAYYEYAKKQNDADLVSIVEALMKYSVSAKAYRNEVISSNN